MSCWALLLLLVASGLSFEDRAIVRLLQSAEPSLEHVTIVKRFPANQQFNLVVALGRPREGEDVPRETFVWTGDSRLGLFLQDRTDAGHVYQLTIKPGFGDDYFARIERITGRELVISGTGEKGSTYDNQKFIFDVRAKTLVAHFSYPPFRVSQLLNGPTGPQFVMADTRQLLLVESGEDAHELRVVPYNEARLALSRIRMEESSVPGDRVYRTPVSPADIVPPFGPQKQFRLATEKTQDGLESPFVVENVGPKEREYRLPRSGLTPSNRRARTTLPEAFPPISLTLVRRSVRANWKAIVSGLARRSTTVRALPVSEGLATLMQRPAPTTSTPRPRFTVGLFRPYWLNLTSSGSGFIIVENTGTLQAVFCAGIERQKW